MAVRVHKALDVIYSDSSAYGFFITVDLKFRESDALYIGKPGWDGMSKTEATRTAKKLAADIHAAVEVVNSAKAHAAQYPTTDRKITLKLQEERLSKLVGKYKAEFVTA